MRKDEIYIGIHSGGQLPVYSTIQWYEDRIVKGKLVRYYRVWKKNPDRTKNPLPDDGKLRKDKIVELERLLNTAKRRAKGWEI